MRPTAMTVLLQHLASPGFFDARTRVLQDVKGEVCGKAIEFTGGRVGCVPIRVFCGGSI